jgi:hypothetical protein
MDSSLLKTPQQCMSDCDEEKKRERELRARRSPEEIREIEERWECSNCRCEFCGERYCGITYSRCPYCDGEIGYLREKMRQDVELAEQRLRDCDLETTQEKMEQQEQSTKENATILYKGLAEYRKGMVVCRGLLTLTSE